MDRTRLAGRVGLAISAVVALLLLATAPASAGVDDHDADVTSLDFCVDGTDLCFEIPDNNGNECEGDDDAVDPKLEITMNHDGTDGTIEDVEVTESGSFAELPEGSGDHFFVEFSSSGSDSGTILPIANPPQAAPPPNHDVDANVALEGTFSTATVNGEGDCDVGQEVCNFQVTGGLDLDGTASLDLSTAPHPSPGDTASVDGGGGPIQVDLFCDNDIASQIDGEDVAINQLDLEFTS